MQQESMSSSALSALSATSPSLATYSSKELADIAARVVHELSISHQDDVVPADIVEDESKDEGDVEDDEEGEFEFAVLTTEDVSADEMFHNGEIKPMYPLFNTELVYGYRKNVELSDSSEEAAGELEQWRTQDFKSGASHELERVPEGAYCVWAPKKRENNVVALKNKSNSTGSTGTLKRWRLRDLVHRSHSDGKDTFVFLNPSHRNNNNGNSNNNGGETKKKEKVTAVKGIYGYKGGKKMDEMKKKKSYLPYRPELVGFFW